MVSGITDATRRFVIGPGAVRGEYVRLGESWRAILARRAYPEPVTSLLGECLAAAALFSSTLKMLQSDGRLTLQIQGGKPVSLLVAECRADHTVRAMARFDAPASIGPGLSLTDLARGASFALTIDPGGDYDAYQSLVPMEDASVADVLNAYMARSEQIESQFALAADGSGCAGLLVQKVPQQGGKADAEADPDAWNRIRTLASSVTRAELLELGDTEILHRLFHQEEVRLLPERAVTFVCRCSKERVASVLRALGRDEIQGLLADRRTIEVDCDFCGLRYTFSAEEAWEALA
ncbi:MAG TPA: Hsp33 family molecular chaperone HslO [Vicinamibacteria bacterium]|nr:Hsp33 family molecular chaperone HslO [Vicinamibacteria bacterium]HRB11499.1 Hsp33 family molecular chaperone HslO [Vicinamibacteria bacterium]